MLIAHDDPCVHLVHNRPPPRVASRGITAKSNVLQSPPPSHTELIPYRHTTKAPTGDVVFVSDIARLHSSQFHAYVTYLSENAFPLSGP